MVRICSLALVCNIKTQLFPDNPIMLKENKEYFHNFQYGTKVFSSTNNHIGLQNKVEQ